MSKTGLELEGYFLYKDWRLFYRTTPFDLMEPDNAIHVEFLNDQDTQYRLTILEEKYGKWEVVFDKEAYWWFVNGVWLSEVPLRDNNGKFIEPTIRLNPWLDSKKKQRLQWSSVP